MEYEQKYKEALKVMESLYNVVKYQSSSDALLTCQTLEKAFPELKESEDEQHRKWILEYLYDGLQKSDEQFKDQFKSAIACLEKQGKQKTVISNDALREGIAHFGITQSQIDNWLKKYVDVEKQGEQKTYPETLDKAIELYYYSYGNEKGGFDNLSLEKFKDIIKTFVDDYGNKSAWSEEDEIKIEKLLKWLRLSLGYNDERLQSEAKEMIDWLKSIKDIAQSQQKQVWSEEDEQMIRSIRCYLNEFGNWLSDKNEEKSQSIYKACNWLKSIKPNHWKPTEEQLKSLQYATGNDGTYNKEALKRLYNDLKSL